ncbi:sodium-dependent transporter [Enterobacteriaceae bacterium BIT-l23]|jgi:NSS family neurotransmitter:Na+ symporter|uniref:Transporter n=1 Tax=Jejubacter calystegiae TaxID=2579935 RepID=A0A4P8YMN3_9ENTR|nr:sodium-dependent transporter [Jejubacter calystegiae]NUU68917.1 sodium-dependent transporter [Enterobacteriaceae bacterium BIT-l23]QCT21336.1 sodium-dependent transporter [Jejubacter calystegiae]
MSQQWSSRLGHVLAAAGSAIGIGAIWKFPYVTATNGGGAFVLMFLFFSFTLGLAILLAEILLGAATHSGVVNAFKKAAGPRWRWLGGMGVLTGWFIFSFYSVVGGWTIGYTGLAAAGKLSTGSTQQLGQLFNDYISHPVWPVLTHLLFSGLTCFVVLGGVQSGLEKGSKIMMPLLFLIMLVLIVTGMSLPGASAGLHTFLNPDFSHVTAGSVLDALGLAFFSLSVGLGVHVTYGAYLPDNRGVARSGLWVVILSCIVCVLAGLMIFPALSASGLGMDSGPGLTFMTMPVFFNWLPGGIIWAVMFFLLLLVAALSSSISLLEHIVTFLQQRFGWSRRNSALLTTASVMLAGIPITLSFGILKDWTLFNKTLFDILDYLTSNLMMPLFGIAISLWFGWSKKSAALMPGDLSPFWRGCLKLTWRFIAPLFIGAILLHGVFG